MRETRIEFIRRVVHLCKPDACSEWPFSTDTNGSGQVWDSGETQQSHRYAWQLVNGPIPEDFRVHHSCDNQACFNPHHLFVWTPRESPKEKNLEYLEKAVALCVPDACAIWPFSRDPHGTGRVLIEGAVRPVNRATWELVNGPIPPGLCVLQSCDNHACFNPHHLFLGNRDRPTEGIHLDYLEKAVPLCVPDVCATWPFSRDTGGAGQARIEGKWHQAHRYAWQLVNGPIPEGFRVYRSCNNRACFNPHHLYTGTALEKREGTHRYYLKKTALACGPDDCCVWPFSRTSNGYGHLGVAGKYYIAHRYAWELVNGPIPPGLFACHKCDNPPCFNPHHLFLGTQLDNVRDMVAKGRHAYGERNPRARVTEAQVREIRGKYVKGIYDQAKIAAEYAVSTELISSIVSRKNWRHLL